jgi:hypothetical protein
MEQNQLNTFDELIEFLKANELTPEETSQIVHVALKCFIISPPPKDEMINGLVAYWSKWKHVNEIERPPFVCFDDIGNRKKK